VKDINFNADFKGFILANRHYSDSPVDGGSGSQVKFTSVNQISSARIGSGKGGGVSSDLSNKMLGIGDYVGGSEGNTGGDLMGGGTYYQVTALCQEPDGGSEREIEFVLRVGM
jgi:hypothetical protein